MDPPALAQVLRPLTNIFTSVPAAGLNVADAAAVYRLNDTQAIVQTIAFCAPVLHNPYLSGAVAAANAMSDVYAMGGEVLFALNIAAFPDTLAEDVIAEIFLGGAEKVREAGGVIAGGHSIYDVELKYGLVVTGMVQPDRILTKAGARPGDRLYLTKRLGTGVLCSRLQSGGIGEGAIRQAINSMLRLNGPASRSAREADAHALTDVRGFGLLGHADEVARLSNVRLVLSASAMPVLDGTFDAIASGIRAGGSNRNEEYVAARVAFHPEVPRALVELLYDPQTSGGLLVAVSQDSVASFEAVCEREGVERWPIGRVEQGDGIAVEP